MWPGSAGYHAWSTTRYAAKGATAVADPRGQGRRGATPAQVAAGSSGTIQGAETGFMTQRETGSDAGVRLRSAAGDVGGEAVDAVAVEVVRAATVSAFWGVACRP